MDREEKPTNNGSGVLLWKNGRYGRMETVCETMLSQSNSNYDFSDIAAHAICRDMGWSHAISWDGIHVNNWNLEDYYTIQVQCTSPYWISCSNIYLSKSERCVGRHIFLTCGLTERLIQGM